MSKHVLVVALARPPPINPDNMRGRTTSAEEIQAQADAGLANLRKAGYEVELYLVAPENFDTFPSTIREKLQSRRWEGYMIGFGLRGTPDYTLMFEKMVNLGREVAPETPMGFNTSPEDFADTVFRILEGK